MRVLDDTKNLQCDDAVKCVFNLNNLDIEVYKLLKKSGELRADELAKKLDKERSTVYRSLQKLANCGMCDKITRNLAQGGYYHVYTCLDNKTIKKHAERCLEQWYMAIKKTLAKLEE
jgi:predicted transcriptional regulator